MTFNVNVVVVVFCKGHQRGSTTVGMFAPYAVDLCGVTSADLRQILGKIATTARLCSCIV